MLKTVALWILLVAGGALLLAAGSVLVGWLAKQALIQFREAWFEQKCVRRMAELGYEESDPSRWTYAEPGELTQEELDVVLRWHNTIDQVSPEYLWDKDHDLAERLKQQAR